MDSSALWSAIASLFGGLFGGLIAVFIALSNHHLQRRIAKQELLSRFTLACIDRRLEAHQLAFHFAMRMRRAINTGIDDDLYLEAKDWWGKNSLYLGEELANDFIACVNYYVSRKEKKNAEISKSEQIAVWDLAKRITSSVNLPALKVDSSD